MRFQEFKRGWVSGLPETACGNGSRLSETETQREWLPRMVQKYAIRFIADIGAGDLNWIQHVDLGCAYKGFDLVPRHPDVACYNVLTDPLPDADCLMMLWLLNHLPQRMQLAVMDKVRASRSRYLIMTYFDGMHPSTDLPHIESAVLKHRRGKDFEIRLCTLQ